MIKKRSLITILTLTIFVFFLSMEKIKLSWEVRTLHNNYENLRIENENLKDFNLKLTTQFHVENSASNIEAFNGKYSCRRRRGSSIST